MITALLLLTAVIVAQCGCTAQTAPEQPAAQTSFGEDWLLNTYCYIQTYEAGQESLIRQAFSVARDFENRLSRTIATSDIGRFNASESGCTVDVDTALLLQDCRDAWERSDHMLDVTMGAVTQLWDFSAEDPKVPDAAAIAEALTHVGTWDKIWIEPIDGGPAGVWQILKDDAGIALDLGAVAKGYIADKTADFLRQHGVDRAVINFGGNVVFVGEKNKILPRQNFSRVVQNRKSADSRIKERNFHTLNPANLISAKIASPTTEPTIEPFSRIQIKSCSALS